MSRVTKVDYGDSGRDKTADSYPSVLGQNDNFVVLKVGYAKAAELQYPHHCSATSELHRLWVSTTFSAARRSDFVVWTLAALVEGRV